MGLKKSYVTTGFSKQITWNLLPTMTKLMTELETKTMINRVHS